MAGVNVNLLGITELKWTGMINLLQMIIIFTAMGKDPLKEMEQHSFNKRVQNVVLECNIKNDRKILIHFQVKPFNIRVIQVYVPTNNVEEAEVD